MAVRDGSVHVASIASKRHGKVYYTHLLRRNYREGGKVKHQTLGNISHLPLPVIEIIKGCLKGETYVPASAALEVVRNLPHGHVAAVLGALRKLEVENLIASRPSEERALAVAMIVARIIDPCSKLATCQGLNDETMFTSLGETLKLGPVETDDFYGAMDWLLGRQKRIENKLSRRHLEDGCLVLYDVSSTYYTGTTCSLAKFGHSRDRKKGFPQIQFGLLCNGEGCPVSVEVFDGKMGEPKTLGTQIEKIRKRFLVKRVILVGDRGMITEARIREDLAPVEGLDWITALRAPAIGALIKQGAIQLSLFDQQDLAEITSPDYPNERLIACRNPILAQERGRKREELLKATEKELDKIVAATQRQERRLKGKSNIGLRVGKVLNRYRVGKHFKLKITEEGFEYQRDREKIAAEAALDGIYVIRTSVPDDKLDSEGVVRAYKDLAKVERAFRSMKMVDLKVRPIHHRLPDRVRAHIFLCMLAYYVEWHMRRWLAPILFDDHEKEIAEALRDSVVSPAQRSPKAKRKATKKRTDDGEPVLSFQSLLKNLATINLNRIQPKTLFPDHTGQPFQFDQLTTPTTFQAHAFELLGVSLTL
jgi:transposase